MLNFSLCSLYDQIIKPSKLTSNAEFHLFKDGVEPKWEDPECANGGKWSVSCRRTNLDSIWLETVNKHLFPSIGSLTRFIDSISLRFLILSQCFTM